MATSLKEQPAHTYLDDIKYQIVKGDNKRTHFVSSDHQIVTQKAQLIKSIEKTEKLVNADILRQQNAILKRFNKLPCNRDKTSYFDSANLSGSHNQRRHSTSCLEKTLSPSNLVLPSSPPIVSPRGYPLLRKTSNSSEGDCSQGSSRDSGDEETPREKLSSRRNSSSGVFKAALVEARRRSQDIQAETSKMALEKLEIIVAGSKRRATIAAGATSPGLLPPSCDLLSRLSRADSDQDIDKSACS